jgi:hypothetical protein
MKLSRNPGLSPSLSCVTLYAACFQHAVLDSRAGTPPVFGAKTGSVPNLKLTGASK